MTPRVARAAVFTFAIAGVGVWCNVMYLQGGERAVSFARGSAASDASQRMARGPRLEYSERVDSSAASASAGPIDAGVVRAIQRELAQNSYGPGPVDGVANPVTRAAIMAYELEHGMPLTGEPSQELLKAMLFGRERSGQASGDPAAPVGPQAEQIIQSVQLSLAKLGYPVGRADGRLGDGTARAIRKFEAEQGLPSTGRISGPLMLKLSEAASRRP